MKKFTLLLTAVLFALPSLARDFEYDGLTYTVLDEDAHTCQTKAGDDGIPGNQVEGNLVIPATVYDGESEYSVTMIGRWGFYYCSELTSVEIPSSVTIIAERAFYYCTELTSVEIPSSVTIIGGSVFEYCYNLTSVEIPSSVTYIGESVFTGCMALNDIWVAEDNPAYCSQGGVLFDKTCQLLHSYPCGRKGHYTIPSSVTEIGGGAFESSNLTSVDIPSSVTKIGGYAFSYCSGLTSVDIPSSVTEIGGGAFYWCLGLTSVTIPSSVTSINGYAFYGCVGLTSVYYNSETLVEGTENIFGTWDDTIIIYEQATLYVRESALPQVETVMPWCLFTNCEAYDFDSAVTGIAADTDAPVEVYTLSGVKVTTAPDALPAGIYVVRQGSNVRKIAVK